MDPASTTTALPPGWSQELASACFAALFASPDMACALHVPGQPDRWYANDTFRRLMGRSETAADDWTPDEQLLSRHQRQLQSLNVQVPGVTGVSTLHLLPTGRHDRLQHDARTPLTAIQVYTECLLDDMELSDRQENDLRQILREVRRLTAVLTPPEQRPL